MWPPTRHQPNFNSFRFNFQFLHLFFLSFHIPPHQIKDIEIPIWICGEPRYISGINTETTCYDIIRALIDDELNNKNYKGKLTQHPWLNICIIQVQHVSTMEIGVNTICSLNILKINK